MCAAYWIYRVQIVVKNKNPKKPMTPHPFSKIFLQIPTGALQDSKPSATPIHGLKILGPFQLPAKKHQKYSVGVFVFAGHSNGKFMEKICLKTPWYYSASMRNYSFWICLWEKPKTHHFYYFGIFEAPRICEQINQEQISFKTISAIHLNSLVSKKFDHDGKDGHREIPMICLITS